MELVGSTAAGVAIALALARRLRRRGLEYAWLAVGLGGVATVASGALPLGAHAAAFAGVAVLCGGVAVGCAQQSTEPIGPPLLSAVGASAGAVGVLSAFAAGAGSVELWPVLSGVLLLGTLDLLSRRPWRGLPATPMLGGAIAALLAATLLFLGGVGADVPWLSTSLALLGAAGLVLALAQPPGTATRESVTVASVRRAARGSASLGVALAALASAAALRWMGHVEVELLFLAAGAAAVATAAVGRGIVADFVSSDARAQATRRTRRYRSLVEHGPSVTGTIDVHGSVSYVSPAFLRVFGQRAQRVEGRPWRDMVHLSDIRKAEAVCEEARTAPGTSATLEVRVRSSDVGWRWCEATVTNHLTDPDIAGLVVGLRDISVHKETQLELSRQALHDPLTDLPNRARLLERLEVAIDRAGEESLAVLFIDLDRFKEVNDSLGHDVGDELIVIVGKRICQAVRPGDLVARFGGDEFVVVCEQLTSREDGSKLAERLVTVLSAPVVVGSHEVRVPPSIGMAFANGPKDSSQRLIRDADAAMYHAKARGRARVEIFDEWLRTEAMAKLETSSSLHRAVERQEFKVLYQPLVSIADGQVTALEALVRWQHPTRGLMLPGEFINLAEDLGLTTAIGSHVMGEAFAAMSEWSEHGLELAINVSGRQLLSENFVESVRQNLDAVGLDPGRICLEVTETVLLDHSEAVAEILAQLRELGLRVGIDDFGAGYTSLSYLKRFPVDVMKIDQSFVHGLCEQPEDAAIVAAVVDLAHHFGMTTVAEGVETAAQLARLATLECDTAQGFLFSQARPAAQVPELLSGRNLVEELQPTRSTYSGLASSLS